MGKKFTVADAEKAITRNYDRLYREAARWQNERMMRAWYEGGAFSLSEMCALMQLNNTLAAQVGTPEPAHLRELSMEEMFAYLRPDLCRAEERLMHHEQIPKPLPADSVFSRRADIDARNADVALVSLIYAAFPDARRKLSPSELMVEDYDTAMLEAVASVPVPDVSP